MDKLKALQRLSLVSKVTSGESRIMERPCGCVAARVAGACGCVRRAKHSLQPASPLLDCFALLDAWLWARAHMMMAYSVCEALHACAAACATAAAADLAAVATSAACLAAAAASRTRASCVSTASTLAQRSSDLGERPAVDPTPVTTPVLPAPDAPSPG